MLCCLISDTTLALAFLLCIIKLIQMKRHWAFSSLLRTIKTMLKLLWPLPKVNLRIPGLILRGTAYFFRILTQLLSCLVQLTNFKQVVYALNFRIVNPFSGIFSAISIEKICLTWMTFHIHWCLENSGLVIVCKDRIKYLTMTDSIKTCNRFSDLPGENICGNNHASESNAWFELLQPKLINMPVDPMEENECAIPSILWFLRENSGDRWLGK